MGRVRRLRTGLAGLALAAAFLGSGSGLAQSDADASLAAPAATLPPPAMGESIAIEVNGALISSFDVYQRMRWLLYWSRLKPTREVLVRIEDEARRMLADEALQIAELRRLSPGGGFIVDNQLVEQRIEVLAKQRGLTSAGLLSDLVDQGIDAETVYAMFRAQMSWDSYIRSRYASRIWIDPARVAARREAQAANAARDLYRIREVVIPGMAKGGRAGGVDFAEALWKQIVEGKISLGEVAEQFSDAASASRGGEIGWVALEDLPAETRTIVSRMGPGQIAPPIESSGQYIIYYVEDFTPAGGQVAFDLVAAFTPSTGDQAEIVARLSPLQQDASCADLKAAANRYPGVVVQPINGATASTIAPDFRDWALRSQEGDVSPIVRTPTATGFVRLCRRYKQAPKLASDEEIKDELFLARLVTHSRSDLNRLRQTALITQRY